MTGMAGAAAGLAVTESVRAAPSGRDLIAEAQRVIPFAETDTLSERLAKFNAHTGCDFRYGLHYPGHLKHLWEGQRKPDEADVTLHVTATDCYTSDCEEVELGWRVYLMRGGEKWSGPMTAREMFHWTAQVGFGYRLGKAAR
jgi:hypothetical protein